MGVIREPYWVVWETFWDLVGSVGHHFRVDLAFKILIRVNIVNIWESDKSEGPGGHLGALGCFGSSLGLSWVALHRLMLF